MDSVMQVPQLPPGALKLRYLFAALFEDGSEFYQQDSDIHPDKPTRTSFYELLKKDVDGNPIIPPNPIVENLLKEQERLKCRYDNIRRLRYDDMIEAHRSALLDYLEYPEDIEASELDTKLQGVVEQTIEVNDRIAKCPALLAETRDDITVFEMEAEDKTRYLVDLRDGHFEIQIPASKAKLHARSFWIKEPPFNAKLKLFYFRRRRHHANATYTVIDPGKPAPLTALEDTSQECEYHFGWETEDRSIRAELILV